MSKITSKNINIQNKRILTYDDMAAVQPGNSQEPLVDVRTYSPTIIAEYEQSDMHAYTGSLIVVRDTVAQRLARVNNTLQEDDLRLRIVYGYRHPNVQQAYFRKRRAALRKDNPEMPEYDLIRLTHDFIAVPDVAGHPMGAAVDLTIVDKNDEPLDMGSGIANYSNLDIIKTYAAGLSANQIANRQRLHDAMIAEGFAPFYGEWWHFSYGDREWAAFYDKTALYGPVDFRIKAKSVITLERCCTPQ